MKRLMQIGGILALVVAAAVHGSAIAATVAMVTEVQGGGELLVHGKRAPLQVRAVMTSGDTLRLAEGARAAVAIVARGEVFHAFGPGAFQLQEQGLAADAASGGKVVQRELAAAIRALAVRPDRNAQATLLTRAGRHSFEAISPKGLQLEADARTLRWRAVNVDRQDEWKYRIVLSDDDGRIVFETTTGATEVSIPGTVALSRDRPYVYEIVAKGPLGRQVEAAPVEFRLIDAQAEERLLRARAAAGDDTTARTLLATAYEEYGLQQAAAQAWQSLGGSAQGRFAAAPPVAP